MRLIDADKLKESLRLSGAHHSIKKYIDSQPTIDAEPVVRCDDCKRSIVNGGDCDSTLTNIHRNHITETNDFVHLNLDYCSCGAKMDEVQE